MTPASPRDTLKTAQLSSSRYVNSPKRNSGSGPSPVSRDEGDGFQKGGKEPPCRPASPVPDSMGRARGEKTGLEPREELEERHRE